MLEAEDDRRVQGYRLEGCGVIQSVARGDASLECKAADGLLWVVGHDRDANARIMQFDRGRPGALAQLWLEPRTNDRTDDDRQPALRDDVADGAGLGAVIDHEPNAKLLRDAHRSGDVVPAVGMGVPRKLPAEHTGDRLQVEVDGRGRVAVALRCIALRVFEGLADLRGDAEPDLR